jgi:hypothetical protein
MEEDLGYLGENVPELWSPTDKIGFSPHYSESQRHFGLGARLYITSSDCAQHGTSALPFGSQRF